MRVGIIGIGFVGSAIKESLEKHLFILNKTLFIYDKYKNDDTYVKNIEEMLDTNILFICLPTPYHEDNEEYDIKSIDLTLDILNNLNYQGICLLKSTVLPNTTKKFADKYQRLKLIHNPEFLSVKTAFDDFHTQTHIVLGLTKNILEEDVNNVKKFYQNYYNDNISIITSTESEIMKLSANSFYAMKIQYFTEIYLLCNKIDCSYNIVKDTLLKNNWINPMHTNIPGSDGKISYGGLCFPKDTNALNKFLEKEKVPHELLNSTINERNKLRKDNLNII
jgi:UDPglucose 6-dehydrogenase